MSKKILGLVVFILGFTLQASAYSSYGGSSSDGDSAIRFGWSLIRDDHTTSYTGQSSTESQTLHISTKGGYSWSNGFYLGALYESSATYYNATGTPTPENRVSYGPSIGYFNSGFFIMGTYFTTTSDTQSNGTSFSGGSGYEAEIGYNYSVTTNFYIGLSVIYNNYTWSQYTSGGTTIGQNNSQTDTYPALGIGVMF